MFNSHVYPLIDDSRIDSLGDHHSHGSGGYVPYDTGSTVIKFVGHTLVNGTVCYNIHVVTDFVGFEIGGEVFCAVATEGTREFGSGTGAITKGVRHSCSFVDL